MRLITITMLLCATPLLAEKKAITPSEFAGAPGGAALPFSPGMLVDGTLYVAGQVGRNLKTGEIPSDFEQEVKQCLEDVGIVLKAGGMGFDDVISVQVYLTDIGLFAKMNAVYAGVFKDPRPARTTVGVAKLGAPNARIEITVTAHK